MFICSVRANEQSFSAPNPFLSAHVLPHFVSHSHDLQLTLDMFGHLWTFWENQKRTAEAALSTFLAYRHRSWMALDLLDRSAAFECFQSV
jgi:hypothetical protein